MAHVRLPSAVFDDTLPSLLGDLQRAEFEGEQVTVDFQAVTFYVPSALVMLLSHVHRWLTVSGIKVAFANFETCPAFGYFQRMDLFALSGIDLTENFTRRDSSKRFVPLCRIDTTTRGRVKDICGAIAACVFPQLCDSEEPDTAGPLDLVEYASSELINNVIQHSRGVGFVAAQVYDKSELVRIAVADCGIGIRQSFEESAPPFWVPTMSHLDAVRTALQPRVSSKMHLSSGWGGESVNAGVGLSMLKEIARHADGLFTVLSGDGFYQHNHLGV